jgi:hypothetical protein
VRLIRCFKVIIYRSLQDDPASLTEPVDAAAAAVSSADPINNQIAALSASERVFKYHALRVFSDVLQNLYTRWGRRSFCFSDTWEISDTSSRQFQDELSRNSVFYNAVISNMPWCISFHNRLINFRSVVDSERRGIQGSDTDPLYR